MTAADERALDHLLGQCGAEALDEMLRQEKSAHPAEVESALLILRLDGLLRGEVRPRDLSIRVMERVRSHERNRLHARALDTIRAMPVIRRPRRFARVVWTAAAALLMGLSALWWTFATDDAQVHVVAGAWQAANGAVVSDGPIASPAIGMAAAQGVTLRWPDGSETRADAGSRLHLDKGTLCVDRGAVRCTVMPHTPTHPFRVVTPHAMVEVVGTVFTVAVGDDTVCRVERGSVSFHGGGRARRVEAGGMMTSAALAEDPPPAAWQLIWADEFAGSGAPDASRWRAWSRRTGINGDLQHYLPECVRVVDGCLRFDARRDPDGWASAALVAQDLRLEPGMRIELRARMPAGVGVWPLVWGVDAQRWPAGAEVVFLSTTGDPPQLRWSLRAAQDMQLGVGPSADPGFHTYAIDWSSSGLTCWRDGVAIGGAATPHHPEWAASIAGGVALALELTVTAEVDPVATDRHFDVDWLRVYRSAAVPP